MAPNDDRDRTDGAKRTHANLLSLRAALLKLHAQLEFKALMLRLQAARKAE
jgi:hypothetical protein